MFKRIPDLLEYFSEKLENLAHKIEFCYAQRDLARSMRKWKSGRDFGLLEKRDFYNAKARYNLGQSRRIDVEIPGYRERDERYVSKNASSCLEAYDYFMRSFSEQR